MKLESSALDAVAAMEMDKILQGDNAEGREEDVVITQLTMTFRFYTADALFISWSYLFVHASPCTTLHTLVQHFLVTLKCLNFRYG